MKPKMQNISQDQLTLGASTMYRKVDQKEPVDCRLCRQTRVDCRHEFNPRPGGGGGV